MKIIKALKKKKNITENPDNELSKKNNSDAPLKKVMKILGNVIFVIIVILILAVVVFLIQGKITGTAPSIAGYKLYVVVSGSMEPKIHTGSIVVVEPIDTDMLKVNDVITFMSMDENNKLITHRIVGIDGTGFITKGDANNINDQTVISATDVMGRVSFSIPLVGYLLNFARTLYGLIILVIIPGLFIIVIEIKSILKNAVILDRKKQESKKEEDEKKSTDMIHVSDIKSDQEKCL